MQHKKLPPAGFLRIKQIVGDPRQKLPGIIPVSAPTWWRGVKEGRFPAPIYLSPGVTLWRVEDIQALVDELGARQDET